jgi:hypothetical protein
MSVDLKRMCFQGLAADFLAVAIPEVPEIFSLESAARSHPGQRTGHSPDSCEGQEWSIVADLFLPLCDRFSTFLTYKQIF